ncbi:MAG: hypothetical protein HY996_07610 [Micrococcales bacterium]|nr:hypothetical protein [Micrococcales bacterium]
MSIPLALPAGRAGAQPGLALSYSSSGGNGIVGIGWTLQVPFIARQTDRGLPSYEGGDRFVYNGGQELVPVDLADDVDGDASNGLQAETVPEALSGYRLFRARVEGGYLRFFLAPDESHWVVQDTTEASGTDFGVSGIVALSRVTRVRAAGRDPPGLRRRVQRDPLRAGRVTDPRLRRGELGAAGS